MYSNSVIELNGYLPQARRSAAKREKKRALGALKDAIDAAVTLGIGVCCAICLVLVFTML